MDDLIKRQDAISAVHEAIISFFDDIVDGDTAPMTNKDKQLLVINKAITSKIKDLQSVEVKHGEWLYKPNVYDDSTYECDQCGEPWTLIDGTPQDNNMNYCPNCGARMDKEEGAE